MDASGGANRQAFARCWSSGRRADGHLGVLAAAAAAPWPLDGLSVAPHSGQAVRATGRRRGLLKNGGKRTAAAAAAG